MKLINSNDSKTNNKYLKVKMLCMLFVFFMIPVGYSATFDVNLADDVHDIDPGDGACDSSEIEGEQCTLRAAIEEANALPGDDVVHLVSGQTYLSELGLLEIDDFSGGNLYLLTESGAPAEISLPEDDTESWRLITVGGRLEMQNVMIRDIDRGDDIGTAINGSGVVNIRNSVFSGNYRAVSRVSGSISDSVFANNITAVMAGFGGETLLVINSVFDANEIAAVANDGSLRLERVTIENGPPQPFGSAVENRNGFLTIIDSEIRNNGSRGLNVECVPGLVDGTPGTKTFVINTLISNNEVTNAAGGGVLIKGHAERLDPPNPACESFTWFINSTISGNRAYETGGGIKIRNSGGATVYLHNTTVVGNLANTSGIRSYKGGGIYNAGNHTIVVRNSIVAGNHFLFQESLNGSDCLGDFTSDGFNIIEQPQDDCVFSGDTSNDIISISPQLAALDNNGGPTRSHAIPAGSPAIDVGNPNGCMSNLTAMLPFVDSDLLSDQRGNPRPLDGDNNGTSICDPGAYEYKWVKQVVNDIFANGFEN